jgi:hypothetical protein
MSALPALLLLFLLMPVTQAARMTESNNLLLLFLR